MHCMRIDRFMFKVPSTQILFIQMITFFGELDRRSQATMADFSAFSWACLLPNPLCKQMLMDQYSAVANITSVRLKLL